MVEHRCTPPFIGRAAVLERAGALLRRASAGSQQSLLITGDAGTGKSAFLCQLREVARASGFGEVVVDGDVLDGAVPYAPLRLSLEALHTGSSGVETAPALAAIAAAPAGWSGGDRGCDGPVIDAFTGLLEAMAFRRPVIVAIDDVHALDPASAELIRELMRRRRDGRVLVVATSRRSPGRAGIPAGRTSSSTDGRLDSVELGGLSRTEFDELAAAVTTEPLGRPDADLLYDITGGVPFFAVELLRAMAESPSVMHAVTARDLPADGEVSLPRRVATAVLHNVERLGPDCRRVAAAVAVLGDAEHGSLRLVSALTELSAERVTAALDRLVDGRVLSSRHGRYRFRHALVRTAVYCSIGPATRQRWHGDVADRLRRRVDSGDAHTLVEVAGHVRRSRQPGPAAARLLTAAGDLVADRDARSAACWYDAALARLAPDDPAVVDSQLRLSSALGLCARHDEAERLANAVLRVAPPGAVRARAAVLAARPRVAGADLERAGAVLDDALGDPATRCSALFLHRAVVHIWDGGLAAAGACLDEARARGPAEHAWLADLVEMHLAVGAGRFHRGAAFGRRVQAQLSRCDPADRAVALLHVALVNALDLDPAVAIDLVVRAGDQGPLTPSFDAVVAYARFRQGHFGDSLRHADSARTAYGADLLHALSVAPAIASNAERGELAAADAIAVDLDAARPHPLRQLVDAAVAQLHLVRGDHRTAGAVLAAGGTASSDRVGVLAVTLARTVDVLLAADDLPGARAANDRLQALPTDETATAMNMLQLRASAVVDGDLEAARHARELSVERGLEFDAARSLATIGSMTADAAILLEAYRDLGGLGATYQQRAVANELRRLGRRVPAGPSGAGTLTAVEQDVAALVAQGLTNRQVALRTSLSSKTVEVYLSRIYGKTGFRSRVELAVAVNDGRLAEPPGHS